MEWAHNLLFSHTDPPPLYSLSLHNTSNLLKVNEQGALKPCRTTAIITEAQDTEVSSDSINPPTWYIYIHSTYGERLLRSSKRLPIQKCKAFPNSHLLTQLFLMSEYRWEHIYSHIPILYSWANCIIYNRTHILIMSNAPIKMTSVNSLTS